MNADERELAASADQALTGQEARRNFIKKSGGMAIAAPAVVLLLAAGSKRRSQRITTRRQSRTSLPRRIFWIPERARSRLRVVTLKSAAPSAVV